MKVGILGRAHEYRARGPPRGRGPRAEQLPGARVVKAFNTIWYRRLEDEARPGFDDRLAVFQAGDDVEAKTLVAGLIEEIGFAAVDSGSLAEGGRRQQPGSDIDNKPFTRAEAEAALRG
jgi:predicted dinucleotide-binding enzyme